MDAHMKLAKMAAATLFVIGLTTGCGSDSPNGPAPPPLGSGDEPNLLDVKNTGVNSEANLEGKSNQQVN